MKKLLLCAILIAPFFCQAQYKAMKHGELKNPLALKDSFQKWVTLTTEITKTTKRQSSLQKTENKKMRKIIEKINSMPMTSPSVKKKMKRLEKIEKKYGLKIEKLEKEIKEKRTNTDELEKYLKENGITSRFFIQ